MKKIKLTYFAILSLLLVNLLILSCSNDGNELLYDSNNNFYKNQLNKNDYMTIHRLNNINNKSIENLMINFDNIDLNNIQLANFGWLNTKIYKLQFTDKINNSIYVYANNNMTYTLHCQLTVLDNGNTNVVFRNTNGINMIEFEMTPDQQFVNEKKLNQELLKDNKFIELIKNDTKLNNQTSSNNNYSMKADPGQIGGGPDSHGNYHPMDNCGAYNFSDCYDCGKSVCEQDWRCDVASSLSGPFFTAGLVLACGVHQLD